MRHPTNRQGLLPTGPFALGTPLTEDHRGDLAPSVALIKTCLFSGLVPRNKGSMTKTSNSYTYPPASRQLKVVAVRSMGTGFMAQGLLCDGPESF